MNASTNIKEKKIYYGWWIVAGCFVLQFLFAGAGLYSFSIFIKPLEDAFGWSRSQISLAMSIYLLISGITGPFIGSLIDRFGAKLIMTISATGTGFAFLLVSLTTSLRFFYLSYAFLALISVGIGFIPASSILTRWFESKRGMAIGLSMAGISMGGLVLAPLIGTIIQHFGWQNSFVFLGAMVWILGLPITLWIIKSHPSEPYKLPAELSTKVLQTAKIPSNANFKSNISWTSIVQSRQFYTILCIFFLAPLAQMGILQHQVPLLTSVGLSLSNASLALGLTAGLGGFGKLCFGRLSDSLRFSRTAIICFGLQAVGAFILFISKSSGGAWLYVILFGFAMGGNIVLLPLAVGEYFNLNSFAKVMGIVCIAQAMGGASGAILSGLLYDSFGNYQLALALYVCFFLCAALISLSLKPPALNFNFTNSPGRISQ